MTKTCDECDRELGGPDGVRESDLQDGLCVVCAVDSVFES